MLTGGPMGSTRARRSMSALRSRMQPCETRPGRSSGSLVPWMPTTTPPGQSVRTGEWALVPKTSGP